MIKKIGFIGLGLMGKPMSLNLVKAGYDVTVQNRTLKKTEPLAQAGARVASNPMEAAAGADAVITMLLEDSNVEEVILGKDGVIESLSEGAIVVDMSTISPITVRKVTAALEEKGIEMLDAPVSGGPIGAEEASLAIMVGGKAEVLDRMLPVFQKMGKNITHIGDHGAGQVAKAANQIIVSLTLAAVSEALIFSKGAGVDPAKVREALLGGFAQSRILELHGKRMLDRDFVPGSKVYTTKKDIEISMTIARKEGICLPSTAFVSHLWNACAAKGGMDWDHAAIVKVLDEMSGIEVTPGAK